MKEKSNYSCKIRQEESGLLNALDLFWGALIGLGAGMIYGRALVGLCFGVIAGLLFGVFRTYFTGKACKIIQQEKH